MRCRLECGWRRCWWSSLHARGNRNAQGRIHLLVSSSGTVLKKLEFCNLLTGCLQTVYLRTARVCPSIPFGAAALSPNFLKKIHKPEAYFNLSLGLNAMYSAPHATNRTSRHDQSILDPSNRESPILFFFE